MSGGSDPYLYDVFVSYPQRGGLKRWVPHVLKPLLEEKLEEAGLEDKPRVYVDTQAIEAGADWPDHLSEAHARSRVFVPVLCAPYFQSGWCTSEWTNAFNREQRERVSAGASLTLVLPVHFNDMREDDIIALKDTSIRDQVRKRTAVNVTAFTCLVNPRADTEDAYLFRQVIERFCGEQLLPAIKAAPSWQSDWSRLPKKPVSGRDPSWSVSM